MLACIVLTQQACVKDLQDDINDGGWNHERTILDIQFENQMGTALIETVDAATGDINPLSMLMPYPICRTSG